jgi:hypothetical protein
MKKKQIQNRDFYKHTGLYTSTANRITVPMEYLKHIDTAIHIFKELQQSLEEIKSLKVAGYRKVAYARSELYDAHRCFIEQADESYNHKYRNGPKVDYKNVR